MVMAIKEKTETNAPKNRHWIGTFEADSEVRKIVAEMLETARKNGKDRAQVAKEMEDALGRDVTPVMLAEFTRIPLQRGEQNGEKLKRRKRYVSLPTPWVPALSAATGSDKLVRHLMDSRNRGLLELAERQHLKFDWALERVDRLYKKLQTAKVRKAKAKRTRKTNRTRKV
jgi:hypothetical protein